jgi:glycosyltransferase involved in cell wall biosynthesis
MRSGEVKSTARQAAACVAANQDTFNLLVRLRGSNQGVHLLSPAIFSQEKINFFQQGREGKVDVRELKIFSGGILDGRKGVAIALMGLAKARQKGVKFLYRIAGGGPERAYLQRVARNLGIQDWVIFQESLAQREYQKELAQTHLFLLPSLREHTGLSLLEAMLSGCVPIVADCGGPGHFVGSDRGFKIPLLQPAAMAELLCERLVTIYSKPQILAVLGSRASQYVSENFTRAAYLNGISAIYEKARSASRACR